MEHHLLLVLCALMLDAVLGDPPWLYRRVPHPVALIGQLIRAGERRWNLATDASYQQTRSGQTLTLLIVGTAALTGFTVDWALKTAIPSALLSMLATALLASSLLATHSLYVHVLAVAKGLAPKAGASPSELGASEMGTDTESKARLESGREAVSHIVGRDAEALDESGVARAAIESLAENFSDGVVAPVFWFVLLGLPGLAAYKAVNTLDSMIGYRSLRYEHFGRTAAKLDDVANWIPARITGALICLAAWLYRHANGRSAWQTMRRDASKHRSPNAGWPEAAMAGALSIQLAGPRQYATGTVDDAWLGDGKNELSHIEIRHALALYVAAAGVLAAGVGLLALVA